MTQEQADSNYPLYYKNIIIKEEIDLDQVVKHEEIQPSISETIPFDFFEVIKMKDEKSDELINTNSDTVHITGRPCFVSVHRSVNLEELSSSSSEKDTASKSRNVGDGDRENMTRELENHSLEGSGYGHHSDQTETSNVENNARNINKKSPDQSQQNEIVSNSSTSETRFIKCMLREIRSTKSISKGYSSFHVTKSWNESEKSAFLNQDLFTEDIHICHECGKTFALKQSMRIHVRVHSREKSYECSHCEKAFSTRTHLKIHLRVHSGEKSHICRYCGKAFNLQTILNVHLRMHLGEKPYQCQECGRAFYHKTGLRDHILSHSGERYYKCSHCEKAFTHKTNFTRHLRIHSGEKPLKKY